MICRKCNTQNEKDNKYCKNCGYRLKAAKRGFASMDADKRKMIASAAGKKAHQLGKAHRFTTQEAIRAGSLGGKHKKKK